MTTRQTITAIVIGLLGGMFIWIAAPYNNFILANAFISDDFMPAGAAGLMLVLVLVVNPLLHVVRVVPKLSVRQLALIFGILLVSSITPSQGGMRHILYPVGATPEHVATSAQRAKLYEALDAPAALFPEPLGYEQPVPASEYFIDQLPEGEPIPWGKWGAPLLAWSGFFGPYWLMLTAMALIVLPYWRETERQPFPLLEAQRAMFEGERNGILPTAMTTPLFWIGFGAVLFLHLLQGLKQYFPYSVPAIPLAFDMTPFFTEHPYRNLPIYVKHFQIHFLFLGIAYFMPSRVAMSIWFFQIAYAIFILIGVSYMPTFQPGVVGDHRLGAWIAIPLFILWMGRRQWWTVLRAVVQRPTSDEQWRNKIGGIGVLLGAAGVMAWLMWVGVPLWWAALLVGVLFLFALGMTRIVAETGVPLMAPNTMNVGTLVNFLPFSWRSAAGVYFSGIVGIVAGHLNRVCAMTVVCHALGMDRKASPRWHVRLAALFFGVIVLSVVVGGAVQVALTYNFSETLNMQMPALGRGGSGYFVWAAEGQLQKFLDGREGGRPYNQPMHIFFGAGLAVFLMVMCQRIARWPIHPVALLFVGNWYAHRIWFSVLLGWSLKAMIMQIAGARGYRASRTLFLGIIIGEVTAVVFWTAVTAIVAVSGGEYQVVRILPI